MKRTTLTVIFVLSGLLLFSSHVRSAGDLTKQKPIEIQIKLGDKNNALRFFPSKLEFETGKLYKLVLHNNSPQKHYFSSDSFSRAVFTRKVQVNGSDGKAIAEIKGSIREIEIYPNGTAEWWFVPVKSENISDLKCTIKGHAEGGMLGNITIK